MNNGYKYLQVIFYGFVLVVPLVVIAVLAVNSFYFEKTEQMDNVSNQELNIAFAEKAEKMTVSAGAVPHHLLAKKLIEDFFKYLSSQGEPDTIVLVGPDHFNAGSVLGNHIIAFGAEDQNFYGTQIDNSLIKDLSGENSLALSDSAIGLDHGITNLMPFIKNYFPGSKVAPFIIPAGAAMDEVRRFTESLNRLAPEKTIVIASVDFSHYLPDSAAELHDVKSIRTLINFEKDDFEKIEVDSWQALYMARYFAGLKNKTHPKIIGHYNSKDFMEKEIAAEEVTSYFSVIFEEINPVGAAFQKSERSNEKIERKTILFVGDIMLDRGVEYFIDKNSAAYPFQEINRFLKGMDIVFGNLEGPVVKNPPAFKDDSLRFAFDSQMSESLSRANFGLLSLANNHTLNMGQKGLDETRELLKGANVAFVGDPVKCADNFIFLKDDVIFLAFNKTFSLNCGDEEIAEIVKSAKSAASEMFLIVSIHWGNEYQLKSSAAQQKLAHKIIDAGADLIIGQHPHVVQEIENYAGKIIFYSLGNFIFDQSFSKETQQGLAVGLEIYSKSLVYRLFPVQINKAQPFLMKKKETEEFLNDLSQKSDSDLLNGIKSGIIRLRK